MASVREIAKRAGVSTATVSRVLNNHPAVSPEVKQRVLSVTNAARYLPAIGRRGTTNVAYVFTEETTLNSPFDAAVLAGVYMALETRRMDLVVLHARRSRRSGETYSQMFLRKGAQGAIVRASVDSHEVCRAIVEEGFPMLLVGDMAEGVPSLRFESSEASREAVEHLIGLGHRRIAVCVNVTDDADHVDRIAGYLDALRAAGLPEDRQLILRVPANREGGCTLVRRMLAMPERPTAVFITDPFTCTGAFHEARVSGLVVPRDLSIIGFDDSELRYNMVPTMTAVCQDATRLGSVAAEMVHGFLDQQERGAVSRPALRCWLEVNASTSPPAVADASGSV